MGVRYENRSVLDLKKVAKKKNLKNYSALKKSELIRKLRSPAKAGKRKSKSPSKKRQYKKRKSPSKKRQYKKRKSPSKKKSKNVIGKLRKGTLRQFGYSSKDTSSTRHRAIDKAVNHWGALPVFRKLNAVAVLQKNSNPRISKRFISDRNYVKRTYMK